MLRRTVSVSLLAAWITFCAGAVDLALSASLDLAEAEILRESPPRDIPQTVWFQGFVADATNGEPLDATYDIIVEMFDSGSGGTSVWGPETHAATTITAGWFNIELGATVDLPTFPTPPYYLELTIGGETLVPRQKLGSVPAAFRSARTDDSDDDWVIQGADIYRTSGYTGIGTSTPARDLDVAGTVRMDGFEMEPGASAGHVLTSDGNGVGTWQQLPSGEADSDWVIAGDHMYAGPSGNVGIGITSPTAKLHAVGTADGITAIEGETILPTGAATGVRGYAEGSTCHGVYGEAYAESTTAYGVYARGEAPGGSATGVYADASAADGSATGIQASATSWGIGSAAYGVYGSASNPDGDSWGVYGTSFDKAVEGRNLSTYASGVLGSEQGGVYGDDGSGTAIWAGYFDGNVRIGGTTSPYSTLDVQGPLVVGQNGDAFDVTFYGSETGSKFLWNESQAALRAGEDNDGTAWAPDSIGSHSIGLGLNPKAIGPYSVAMGSSAVARESDAIAIGSSTSATAEGAFALGMEATSDGYGSIAIGRTVSAGASGAVAIGAETDATATNAVAIGSNVEAQATDSFVLGTGYNSFNPLVNDVGGSLMVGFDSTVPTLFVGGPSYRVGIGTSEPASKLDVSDIIQVRGHTWPLNNTGRSMEFAYNPTDHRGYIQVFDRDSGGLGWGQLYLGGGSVGIGATTNYSEMLDVVGDIECVALHETSDGRLKTDVRELTGALDAVGRLRGVSFAWNEESSEAGATPGERSIGLIAQEVEEVLPELVTSPGSGHKTLDYSKLTAVLIEAVKELREENEALRDRVEALESAR